MNDFDRREETLIEISKLQRSRRVLFNPITEDKLNVNVLYNTLERWRNEYREQA